MASEAREAMALVTLEVSSPYASEITRYPLRQPLVVGRARNADVRLLDPRVSRSHARLSLSEQGRLLVEDLGSTNGTGAAGRLLRSDVVTLQVPAVIHVEPFVIVARRDDTPSDETLRVRRRGDLLVRPLPDGGIDLGGVEVRAAPLERRLLEILAIHHPDSVSHAVLGDGVWGTGCWEPYMLQNLVRRCRARLSEVDGGPTQSIESIRGLGYRLVVARPPRDG